MKQLLLLLTVWLVFANQSWAQKAERTIRSNKNYIDIKEGRTVRKNFWRITPECELDVFETVASRVAFYTDVDTIEVELKVGEHYDFDIKLGKDQIAKTRIERQESRVKILKESGKYSQKASSWLPKLEYESADSPNLKRVRKELRLDSIAGNGDELSKILNLMYWVHNNVKLEGNARNPKSMNAIDLIKLSKGKKRGFTSRVLATILNESYLAMGFKSHTIICLTKENIQSSHVINSVYSKELEKWIWIDPSFAAYVTDEKGELLGISEVRERMINDKPLLLNRDANWNRISMQYAEDYLGFYMAKYLYRVQMPLVSGFGYETLRKDHVIKHVRLVPESYKHRRVKRWSNPRVASKIVIYTITNDQEFWAKPE